MVTGKMVVKVVDGCQKERRELENGDDVAWVVIAEI